MSSETALVYRFGGFELDPGRFELREDGQPRHLEPQVLSLLILLASNADRLVSKDEIVENIWGGRFISDAAVASRIKAARQALGDDGRQQRFIRTVHGKGFRFHAPVLFARTAEQAPSPAEERPSIAVLPFRLVGEPGPLAFVAEALADELIADLARLHWLLVIARASTFRFRGRDIDCAEVGAALHARYCLTGTLADGGDRVTVSLELARTSDSGVIWAERFVAGRSEFHELQHEILNSVAGKLESRIVHNEIEAARRTRPAALGAWSSYHLGLDAMFRFNRSDNAAAAELFRQALDYDPHFSRALSGLSFTAFQDCFLQYSDEPEAMARQARELAEQALHLDPLDPFAHLNLARSLWVANAVPDSIDRLTECIGLSPNYAQAIYSKAWAEMAQCDVARSDGNAALALRLSPLDPLRYAMLGVRSVSALMREDAAAAFELGEKAARSPGAHKLIAVIAALGAQAAGRADRAEAWVARARELDPNVSHASFLRAFPFAPTGGRETVERGLRAIGL